MIELKNVSKRYGDKQILSNVNAKVNKGEILGLIGLSGAGKSTLLRIINNLETQSSGEVIVNKGIKFGFVFQTFNLVGSLSVGENIKLALLNSNLPKAKINSRVLEVLELVGLGSFIHSKPSQLSGGQKQRVGIARALIADIDVLLCDEATSSLDPFTSKEIICLLSELNEKLGLTIVFVSHQLEIVRDFCDRIGILDKGSLCEIDQTIKLFSAPKSKVAIKLLSNVLGFERYLKRSDIGLITCYNSTEISALYPILIENDIAIESMYQHHTKQGIFAHFFIKYTESIEGFEIRRINGL